MMRRMLLALTLVCAMLALPLAAASAKTLQMVTPWEIKALDTTKNNLFASLGIAEKLVSFDNSGKLFGLLASSWSISADKLTWTFDLHSGVKFHDGSVLTAEAAAKSLLYAFENKGVLSRAPIAKIAAAGPLTVKITTSTPFATLPAYLSHNSSTIVAPSSFNSEGKMTKVIGTGYYTIKNLKGNNTLTLVAFPGYRGKKPSISNVVYNAVTKVETRAMMMQAGQAQLGSVFSPMAAVRLAKDPNFRVQRTSMPRVRIIKLNCGIAPFNDVRVRKAISLAINRKAIAKSILRNEAMAATQLLPPSYGGWFNEELEPLTFDMAKAKKLLSEAGWQLGSDGVLQKDGQPFKVTLFTYPARPMLPTIATAIQAQLKDVGIKIELVIGKWTVIPQTHKDGTMQMSLFSRNYGLLPDAGGTLANDFSKGGAAWGSMGWKSPAYDKAVAEYLGIFDPAKSVKVRKLITGILQDELPVIPIAWTQKALISHKSLIGARENMFELTYYLDQVKWAE